MLDFEESHVFTVTYHLQQNDRFFLSYVQLLQILLNTIRKHLNFEMLQ
jgi:hypothetical protein